MHRSRVLRQNAPPESGQVRSRSYARLQTYGKPRRFLFFNMLFPAFRATPSHRVDLIHQIFGGHRAVEKLVYNTVFLCVPDILRRLFFGV